MASFSSVGSLSDYAKTLTGTVRERYLRKLDYLNGVDPYDINLKTCSLSQLISDFPSVNYVDIVGYFKYCQSPYTDAELRAVKSTEAFKLFLNGWVRDLRVKKFNEYILLLGKVLHSQRLNEKPLLPWAVCRKGGEVICGHCTCIAGLGEGCSHLGALLWACEKSVRDYEDEPVAVTSKKAYWKAPSEHVGEQQKLQNIDFTSSKQKFEEINDDSKFVLSCDPVSEPSAAEQLEFLNKLKEVGDVALLKVKAPFCFEEQQLEQEQRGQYLTAIYNEEHLNKTLNVLQSIAEDMDLSFDEAEYEAIEKNTVHSPSPVWFGYRSGRITASLFKRVCRTSIVKPSISLIKQVCYPDSYNFVTTATKYGCTHEKIALKQYSEKMELEHKNFKIWKSGFIISRTHPQFGATPDSLIYCDCHGEGCVEIKCPFCIRDTNIHELRDLKKLCLQRSEEELKLKEDHSYFYQVQMQLAVSGRAYCDFVVWTRTSLFIQRMFLDEHFWSMESKKALEFQKKVILPELLGKYFTRTFREVEEDSEKWCLCRKPDDGSPMLACDNINCSVVWYHFSCVDVSAIPNGPWHCLSCSSQDIIDKQ